MAVADSPSPAKTDLSAYLAAFQCASARAMSAAGAKEVDLCAGAGRVRLRFAGPGLIDLLLSALAHLRVKSGAADPDLTIELWDADSTGVPAPRPAWAPEDVLARGAIRGYTAGDVRVAVQHGDVEAGESFGAVMVFDQSTATVRFFVPSPSRIPWYERAAPLRTALHWGLSSETRPMLHAGAVGQDGRGLLLAGPGGAGKSTTAVAAMLGGLQYAGDDYLLMDLAGPEPVAHSLYGTAKLAPDTTALLPGLRHVIAPAPAAAGHKHVLDVLRLAPSTLCRSLRIQAIVLPRLGRDTVTRVTRASAGEVLLALAPSTILQAPRADAASLRPLAELARRLPAYHLELGGRPAEIPGVLARLLNERG